MALLFRAASCGFYFVGSHCTHLSRSL